MTGKISRQFRLLTWISVFDQFVHPEIGKGMGDRYLSQLQVSLSFEKTIMITFLQKRHNLKPSHDQKAFNA